MTNFFKDNEDLQFYFEKGIDWEPLIELTEYQYRAPDGFDGPAPALEFYRDVLDLIGDFVATQIAPHVPELDRAGVRFENGEAVFPKRLQGIFDELRKLELYGMTLPRELGGMNCPMLLYFMSFELFSRADASILTHYSFHGGIAMAMLYYSILEGSTTFDAEKARLLETRFAAEIEEIRAGEAWGSMDITEPDAGSDMAALRATARQDDDGTWRVTGNKIFITSGHGKYHFVIARTEAARDPSHPLAGLEGLSMFLVPAWEQDADGNRRRLVSLDRLEEKLGHHASATASVTFDDSPAHLIGERGEGFKYMLLLMNNARVGVGFEALGVCEAVYRLAKAYAAERRSMGKTIDRHEMLADWLDEMHTDIQGLRALAVAGGYAEEMGHKLDLLVRLGGEAGALVRADDTARSRAFKATSRRLTPLLKYLGAEKAVEMARRGLQIHGGVGYTREYGAEKLLRDALVMPIYEGTSQIQALMVMKDALTGVMKNPQGFLRRLAQTRWRALSSRDPLERRLARLQTLTLQARQHLMARTATDKVRSLQGKPVKSWPREFLKNWNPKRDFAFAMLHAENLTRMLGDEAICELLWAQARKHPERRDVLERYLERAEPRCRHLLDKITTTGERLLDELGALAEGEAAETETRASSAAPAA